MAGAEGRRSFDAGRRCLALLDAHPDGPEALARWLVDCGLVPEGTPLDAVDDGWVERFAELRDHIGTLVRAEVTAQAAAGPTGAAGPAPPAGPAGGAGAADRAGPAATPGGLAADSEAPASPPRTPHPAPHSAPALDQVDAPALDRVNALAAAAAPPAPRAAPGPDGRLVRALDTPPRCAALLAALARDAVELLTDPAARARLRECEGDDCHRVYLDTSRGARRRWCSSATCGNRDRVARHRARTGRSRDG
ncbi:CGNR zinc finger domain-containing protein [Streptomyces thermolilacinus]|uniref:CGNR zinc finger domain-containing protein n=1 Tax=Streptomyces thermolilacinus TaxID=285540 RepID=UPI0033D8D6EC